MDRNSLDWIAVDWGTTHLRAWAMDIGGRILDERKSPDGMGRLDPEEFENALLEQINDWIPSDGIVRVFACGMVGARQGWIEAPYQSVPCEPITANALIPAPTKSERISVKIVGGLSQSFPPDVIRGEETPIGGLIANDAQFDGIVCMPGTHTKWVRVSNGKVSRFNSFITGELFSLLEKHSILRFSLASSGLDKEAFGAEAEAAWRAREPFISQLFSLRAADLLRGDGPEYARAKLSAMMIAAEVRAAHMAGYDGKVVLVGEKSLVDLYSTVLEASGTNFEIAPGTELVIAGLSKARSLSEQSRAR